MFFCEEVKGDTSKNTKSTNDDAAENSEEDEINTN